MKNNSLKSVRPCRCGATSDNDAYSKCDGGSFCRLREPVSEPFVNEEQNL